MLRILLLGLAAAPAALAGNSSYIPQGTKLRFNDTNVRTCVAAEKSNITACVADKVAVFNASIDALRDTVLPAVLNALVSYAQSSGRRNLAARPFDGPSIESILNQTLYPLYQTWWCNRGIQVFNIAGSCIKPCLDPTEGTLLGVQLFDKWCELDFIGHDPSEAPDVRDNGSYANDAKGYAGQYVTYLTASGYPVISPLSRFWKINGSFANETRDDILNYYGCPNSCPKLIQTAMDSSNGGAGIVADSGVAPGSSAASSSVLSVSAALTAVLAVARLSLCKV